MKAWLMSGGSVEMSHRWPVSDTHMPAAWVRDSEIAACKAPTFSRLGNDFKVICWFKAMAKLSSEIIRRHQALAQPPFFTMRPQLKVSVSLAGHFPAGKGDHETSLFMGHMVWLANRNRLHLKLFFFHEQMHVKNGDIDQWRKVRRTYVLVQLCVFS